MRYGALCFVANLATIVQRGAAQATSNADFAAVVQELEDNVPACAVSQLVLDQLSAEAAH
jgi:hypothetical protein